MRQAMLLSTFLLAAVLVAGCTSKEGKPVADPEQRKAVTAIIDNAKTETRELGRSIRDFAFEQKSEFVVEMKGEMARLQIDLDLISDKVEKFNGEAKAEAKVKLEVVRKKWDVAKKQLEQAENATESTWSGIKDGFNESLRDSKDSFQEARQWLSDKIEP